MPTRRSRVAASLRTPDLSALRSTDVDRALLLRRHLDLARALALRHRYPDREHAVVVARVDLLRVEVLPQIHLPAEAGVGSLAHDELVGVGVLGVHLAADGQH